MDATSNVVTVLSLIAPLFSVLTEAEYGDVSKIAMQPEMRDAATMLLDGAGRKAVCAAEDLSLIHIYGYPGDTLDGGGHAAVAQHRVHHVDGAFAGFQAIEGSLGDSLEALAVCSGECSYE